MLNLEDINKTFKFLIETFGERLVEFSVKENTISMTLTEPVVKFSKKKNPLDRFNSIGNVETPENYHIWDKTNDSKIPVEINKEED